MESRVIEEVLGDFSGGAVAFLSLSVVGEASHFVSERAEGVYELRGVAGSICDDHGQVQGFDQHLDDGSDLLPSGPEVLRDAAADTAEEVVDLALLG